MLAPKIEVFFKLKYNDLFWEKSLVTLMRLIYIELEGALNQNSLSISDKEKC